MHYHNVSGDFEEALTSTHGDEMPQIGSANACGHFTHKAQPQHKRVSAVGAIDEQKDSVFLKSFIEGTWKNVIVDANSLEKIENQLHLYLARRRANKTKNGRLRKRKADRETTNILQEPWKKRRSI